MLWFWPVRRDKTIWQRASRNTWNCSEPAKGIVLDDDGVWIFAGIEHELAADGHEPTAIRLVKEYRFNC